MKILILLFPCESLKRHVSKLSIIKEEKCMDFQEDFTTKAKTLK